MQEPQPAGMESLDCFMSYVSYIGEDVIRIIYHTLERKDRTAAKQLQQLTGLKGRA